MQKSTKMTVLPIRTIAMTSPTVTSMNNKETKTSRISNFSVASLLADTKRSSTPPAHTAAAVIRVISENNNNNDHDQSHADICLVPKNLSINNNSSCSPNSSHNNNDSSNNSIKLNDSELLDASQRSHTPHSSIASEEDYDDSMRDDEDDEDSIVDIEDVKNENSKNEKGGQGGSLMPGQAPPIRPTPFSALAAAAAAWSMNNGVPGWPNRQMPPFGPPGLFPGQHFGGQMNGGV